MLIDNNQMLYSAYLSTNLSNSVESKNPSAMGKTLY